VVTAVSCAFACPLSHTHIASPCSTTSHRRLPSTVACPTPSPQLCKAFPLLGKAAVELLLQLRRVEMRDAAITEVAVGIATKYVLNCPEDRIDATHDLAATLHDPADTLHLGNPPPLIHAQVRRRPSLIRVSRGFPFLCHFPIALHRTPACAFVHTVLEEFLQSVAVDGMMGV